MPAEWVRHAATWMGWPHNRSDWPGKAEAVAWAVAEIVLHLTRTERVEMLVPDANTRRRARSTLAAAGVNLHRVGMHTVASDRSWTRDALPSFVRQGRRAALVDWRFNGWARYGNHRKDDALGAWLASRLGLPRHVPTRPGTRRRVVLEGGAVDSNGEGLLLTSEECLLSRVQARNPGLGRRAMEDLLRTWLGVEKVLWLGRGIAGDDTHGHIDDLARFVGPSTVVAAVETRRSDINYKPLRDNLVRLRRMRDLSGRRLEVAALPMPRPLFCRGARLPASYANFYIANGRVLVPTFNDPHDREALATLAGLFPRREVVGIHAVDLVWGLGTLHCMTWQQPA
ncbi:MAG: agmatine deiminase family protein [Acidobacteria bacterium]|nr:agmatine deiminase family protein [Acidobacteriota bacterium]